MKSFARASRKPIRCRAILNLNKGGVSPHPKIVQEGRSFPTEQFTLARDLDRLLDAVAGREHMGVRWRAVAGRIGRCFR